MSPRFRYFAVVGLVVFFASVQAVQAAPPNNGKYASLQIEVNYKAGRQLRPVRNASLELFTSMRDSGSRSVWQSHRRYKAKTDTSGRLRLTDNRLGLATTGGKAFIPRDRSGKKKTYRIEIRVLADGYKKAYKTVDLTYSRPSDTVKFVLKKTDWPAWVRDDYDKLALRGFYRRHANGNVVAFPLIIAKVQDTNGRAIEGATVYLKSLSGKTSATHTTRKKGEVTFSPYDFRRIPGMPGIHGRPGMTGSLKRGTKKGTKYTVLVTAEANGFKSSEQRVTVSTFEPKATTVFHLKAGRGHSTKHHDSRKDVRPRRRETKTDTSGSVFLEKGKTVSWREKGESFSAWYDGKFIKLKFHKTGKVQKFLTEGTYNKHIKWAPMSKEQTGSAYYISFETWPERGGWRLKLKFARKL